MDIAGDLFAKLSSECGLVSMLLFGGLAYQTWQLGRLRQQRDEDRKQIVDDAIARTRAADAAIKAQQEMAIAIASAQARKRRYDPA